MTFIFQVEFTFSLSDNESTDVCMQYVLMRFECTRELSTGKTVVPVLTLPILVAATPAAIGKVIVILIYTSIKPRIVL